MNARNPCALLASFGLAALSALAEESADEWLAKARAYLGPEKVLNTISSVHFEGRIDTTERSSDGSDVSRTIERPLSLAIDIVFQKPMQHRQILRSEKGERMTVLDGYDAWEKVSSLGSPASPRLTLLASAEIKRLQAATIENLSFYSHRDRDSRRVSVVGNAELDGLACVKLSFTHNSGVFFVRYFEKSTGRLMKTELDNGGEIREEGELLVNGVRFPRKMINKSADGKLAFISFTKVTMGEMFPPDTFSVPSVPAR